MPLVDVKDGRLEPECREGAHAADAEQQLLADPVLAVAAVEGVGEQVDVEQVERHRADVAAPHRGRDGLARQVDFDGDRLAHEAGGLGVDPLVDLGLPSLVAQPLHEVPAAVEETDADERHAEIRRRLQVVAGQHAEPARVDRQARVDSELHAEVGDEQLAARVRLRAGPPGVGAWGVGGGQRVSSRGSNARKLANTSPARRPNRS